MTFKTVEGVSHPDGRLDLPRDEAPDRPMRVMVTIHEEAEESTLLDLGDYLEQLEEYEERLARGEIQWR